MPTPFKRTIEEHERDAFYHGPLSSLDEMAELRTMTLGHIAVSQDAIERSRVLLGQMTQRMTESR